MRLAIFLVLCGCGVGANEEDRGATPPEVVDARAATQTFECSRRHSETTRYPTQVLTTDHHYAAIGQLNPADAPRATVWICDFSCEQASCGCPEGAICSSVGSEVEAEQDGWCTTGTVNVRPSGEAVVPCGSITTIVTEGVTTRYGMRGQRVYVRLE